MTGVVQSLVACGALAKKKTGPANPMQPEEAARVRREQCSAAAVRRKIMIRDARENGLPAPSFARGRPRKYATHEEAMEARRAQCKIGGQILQQRIKEGTAILRSQPLMDPPLARWSA